MLRIIFVFLLVAFKSLDLSAQAYKDSIESQFLRYTDLLIKKEYARSTDYLNPGFFKIVPKAQLIKIMEKSLNDPNADFTIESPNIISIGNSKTIAKQSYVKLKYSNYMSMHFKTEGDSYSELAHQSLQGSFGEENVKYDSATNTFRIFVVKDVIANSVDNKNWTFVVLEEKQKPILEKFIPKELL
jgi:hypothetical protein